LALSTSALRECKNRFVDEFLSPEDLERAGDLAFDAISPGASNDWHAVLAGSLQWTVHETVVHMASTCIFYSAHLAGEARAELPITLASAGNPSNLELLETVTVTLRVMAGVARSPSPMKRGYHWAGLANVSGFLAMGCDEILIHAHDVAQGLELPFSIPEDLASGILARLYPWAPDDVAPSQSLLWVNGRLKLPGRSRQDWQRWHCAPLEEWDGTTPNPVTG
jgi:hypothetical protein